MFLHFEAGDKHKEGESDPIESRDELSFRSKCIEYRRIKTGEEKTEHSRPQKKPTRNFADDLGKSEKSLSEITECVGRRKQENDGEKKPCELKIGEFYYVGRIHGVEYPRE